MRRQTFQESFKFQRNRVSRKTLMARRKSLEITESLRLEEWYRPDVLCSRATAQLRKRRAADVIGIRLAVGRARCSTRAGPGPARARVNPHDRALRQPEAGGTSSSRRTAGRRQDVRSEEGAGADLSAEAVSRDSATAEVSRIFQDPTAQRFAEREDPAGEFPRSH